MNQENLEEAGGLPEFLVDPQGIAKRRWKAALLAFLAVAGICGAAIWLRYEPTYEATARVLVSSPTFSEEFVPSIETGGAFETLNALIGELLTRDALADIVLQTGIYSDLREQAPLAEVVGKVRAAISIYLDSDFGDLYRRRDSAQIFAISFSYEEPHQAAVVANELASRFVFAHIDRRTEHARVTSEFMEREREKVESELVAQTNLITALKQQARGELPSDLTSTLSRLERLQTLRQSLTLQIAQAEANLVALTEQQQGEGDDMPPSARLESMRSNLADLRNQYTDDHPDVIAAQRQFDTLAQAIEAGEVSGDGVGPYATSRKTLRSSTQTTLENLRQQLRETDVSIAALDQRVERIPTRAEQLEELERKATILRHKYDEFEEKARNADLALRVELEQQGRRVAILEKATPPSAPSQSYLKFIALGVVASIGSALALALLLELVDPVLISGAQVERRFGVPVLGSVPPLD